MGRTAYEAMAGALLDHDAADAPPAYVGLMPLATVRSHCGAPWPIRFPL
jgi:hypothetical protein